MHHQDLLQVRYRLADILEVSLVLHLLPNLPRAVVVQSFQSHPYHVQDYLLSEKVVIQSLYIAGRLGQLFNIDSFSNYPLILHNDCIFENIMNAFVFIKPRDSPRIWLEITFWPNGRTMMMPLFHSGYSLGLPVEIAE